MITPLFPLNAMVLPMGRMPLQIFEARYLDMLTRCLKEDRGFVNVMLREGEETSNQVTFYPIGTYVRVVDFDQLDNGLLAVTIEGVSKAVVIKHWQQPDGLFMGDVEWLDDEPASEIDPADIDYLELVSVLKALLKHPAIAALKMTVNFADVRHVGWRLIELLPMDRAQKHQLISMTNPRQRLDRLLGIISALQ